MRAPQTMLSSLRKYLLIPKLMKLASSAPRNPQTAWDQYWGRVGATGAEGEVLWDSGSDHEMHGYVPLLERYLDLDLPVLDVGCGNGSFTRRLAAHFPHAIGVDVSPNAINRAKHESEGKPNVSFAVCDATDPDAVDVLRSAIASGSGTGSVEGTFHKEPDAGVNVFIRGVLHVLGAQEQAALVRNLHPLLGRRGRLFLAETDFPGNAVDYVCHLGATLESIPAPLEGAIRGLPMPGRFGAEQRRKAFPDAQWELLADGPATIETRPLKSATETERIPGYFAVLRAR
jgi:SAM-dependent methyltransferase